MVRRPSQSLVHNDVHRDILRAAGSSTTLALETDEPGHYTYSFDRVGDRNYGLSPLAGRPLTFDHEVYGRPSARWQSTDRLSRCAHSKLKPASLSAKQGLLALKGKAPYAVTLHITTPKSSQPIVRTIADIPTDEWRIDLDDVEFTQLGLHTISVESVADASGCAQDLTGEGIEDAKAFKVEVAETASIVQVQKGEDVCVGQSLDFLLQGTSPWSLTCVDGRPSPNPDVFC
jgi:nucleoporin POM152